MPEQYVQAWWGTWWPWAEANQGLLSTVALVIAFIAFIVETVRANQARADATRLAAEAEQASRDNAREQLARDREAALDAERRIRAAEQRANAASRRAVRTRIEEYVRVASLLITKIEHTLEDANTLIAPTLTDPDGQTWPWRLPPDLQMTCTGIGESMTALLPSCPLDPELILSTQQASARARHIGARTFAYSNAGAAEWLTRTINEVRGIRSDLNERMVLLTRSRPLAAP